MWPDDDDYSNGLRFIDPCTPSDDHDEHWRVGTDGSLEPLTKAGEYTIEHLKLWRDQLKYHRAACYRWQNELNELVDLLNRKKVSQEQRERLDRRIAELKELLEPPVFNRPRGRKRG